MGLRLKLGLAVGALISGVFAFFSIVTVETERRIIVEEMRLRSVALVSAFAIPTARGLAAEDAETIRSSVADFRHAARELGLRELAVLDVDGRVVAHTVPSEVGRTYRDLLTMTSLRSDTHLAQKVVRDGVNGLVVMVPVVSGERWGTLRADFSLDRVETAVAESRRRVVLIAVFSAGVFLALAYAVFSFFVIGPVLTMQQMAKKFGRGRLGERVEISRSDEIGQLAGALNGMAQQIQDYTESLENLVEARTAELASTNVKLVRANQELERLARTDALTGLHNRRHFMEQLDIEVTRGSRIHHQFAVVMLDVDHFKSFNDQHGHTEGDDLLLRLGHVLQGALRSTDVVARYGGEEFVILLLDTGPEEAHAAALKLQRAVADHRFPFEESQPGGRLTVSVGIAFYPNDSRSGRKLLQYADQALYKSKQLGRNRVTRYCDIPDLFEKAPSADCFRE